MGKMNALVIETSGRMYISKYGEPLYKTVGGDIEIVHPCRLPHPYCMLVNEDGKMIDLPINVIGSRLYGYAFHGDPIVGDIVLMQEGMRNGELDIVGLTDANIDFLFNLLQDEVKR